MFRFLFIVVLSMLPLKGFSDSLDYLLGLGDLREAAGETPPSNTEFLRHSKAKYEGDIDRSQQYVCITDLTEGFSDAHLFSEDFLESDPISCQRRDQIVLAMGTSSVVLKGISFACKAFPHVGAKVSAEIMNFGGYVTGTIGFYWATQDCKDEDKIRQRSLEKACLELRAAGLDCGGVGW